MGMKENRVLYSEPSDRSATLYKALGSALTDTYASVGAEMPIENYTTAFLHVYWTKGDETSIEVKAEYALVSGGTEAQPTIVTTAAAESTLAVESYTFSTGTDGIIIPFGVNGNYINFYIKATGGTPTGTYGAGIFLVRE